MTSHASEADQESLPASAKVPREWLRRAERALRPHVRNVRWQLKRPLLAWLHPQALALYLEARARAYIPDELIDILPDRRILYIAVPKAASSRIRATLSALIGRDTITKDKIHNRKASGLRAPRHGILDFYRVATDPGALRFSFVRNPYDRILSCWADQYRNKPLVPGDRYIDAYLKAKRELGGSLPEGASQTLSFADFVTVVTANADRRIDMHWQLQSDILAVPGVTLNLIGKIENFSDDFARVLDHAGVHGPLRHLAVQPVHASKHGRTADYYTGALAKCVHRAYARDFDQFRYSRTLPD